MAFAIVFLEMKTRKLPKCPLTKNGYLQGGILTQRNIVMKMNALGQHSTIWMNLLNVMLSRRSWAKIVPTVRFHSYKVQMQVQWIHAVTSQNSGDLGGCLVTRQEHAGRGGGVVPWGDGIFCFLIWVLYMEVFSSLKSTDCIFMICVLLSMYIILE